MRPWDCSSQAEKTWASKTLAGNSDPDFALGEPVRDHRRKNERYEKERTDNDGEFRAAESSDPHASQSDCSDAPDVLESEGV